MRSQIAFAGLLLLVAAPRLLAAPRRSSGVSLRKRLNVNDLITEPGTVEPDWGSLYSYTTSAWTMPSALKFNARRWIFAPGPF